MQYTVKTKSEQINIKAGRHRINGGALTFEDFEVKRGFPSYYVVSNFVAAFAPGEWEWVRPAPEGEVKDTA